MASLLSASQLSQLRTLFQKTDATGSGSLTAAQVAHLLRIACSSTSGPKPAITDLSIRDLLTEVDVGEEGTDGRCDFEEFVNLFTRTFETEEVDDPTSAAVAAKSPASPTTKSNLNGPVALLNKNELTELKQIFRSLDVDQDQYLTPADLQQAFDSIGDHYSIPELEQMIREVDSTRTGKIKLGDFLAAMSPA